METLLMTMLGISLALNLATMWLNIERKKIILGLAGELDAQYKKEHQHKKVLDKGDS